MINIIAFIDRNYNLLFHKNKVIKIVFESLKPSYNDVLSTYEGINVRCLGKNLFKILK